MAERNFFELLEAQWAKGKFACIGIDPVENELRKLYGGLSGRGILEQFCQSVVMATREWAGVFKPNYAFFEGFGLVGLSVLYELVRWIHIEAPEVPVILDCKRMDIGNSNVGTVASIFDKIGADAITVHNYLGAEAAKPLLDRKNKGIIVLCHTSNSGAPRIQHLECMDPDKPERGRRPLYQHVALQVAEEWNYNGNCGLVTGGTYADEIASIRQIVGDMFLLIPGAGSQGALVSDIVPRAVNSQNNGGYAINSSSAIIFASTNKKFLGRHPEFANSSPERHFQAVGLAAREFDEEIRRCMQELQLDQAS